MKTKATEIDLHEYDSPIKRVDGTVLGAGICDFCGEHAPALKVFNHAPMAGAVYCRKCAPLSETDADWPNTPAHLRAGREAGGS